MLYQSIRGMHSLTDNDYRLGFCRLPPRDRPRDKASAGRFPPRDRSRDKASAVSWAVNTAIMSAVEIPLPAPSCIQAKTGVQVDEAIFVFPSILEVSWKHFGASWKQLLVMPHGPPLTNARPSFHPACFFGGGYLAPSSGSWNLFWLQLGVLGLDFGSKLEVLGGMLAPS